MNDESQGESSPLLPSKVYDFAKMAPDPTPMGERRRYFFSPTATLDQCVLQMSSLDPGKSPHPPHQHPDEEMIMIKEGTLEISLNGKLQRVGPGSVVFVASNDLHGWTNVGTERANYWVLRWWTAKTGPDPSMLK